MNCAPTAPQQPYRASGLVLWPIPAAAAAGQWVRLPRYCGRTAAFVKSDLIGFPTGCAVVHRMSKRPPSPEDGILVSTVAPKQPGRRTRFDHAFSPGRRITGRPTMAWRIVSMGDPRRHRMQFWQNEIPLFAQAKSVPCRGVSELLGWSGPARRRGCQSVCANGAPRLTCMRSHPSTRAGTMVPDTTKSP